MDCSLDRNNTSNNTTSIPGLGFRASLLFIYTVALLGGTIGIFFMVRYLKQSKNELSITTTCIINLLVAHGLFLLTIPFRIDYYATNTWRYPFIFCKLVSIAIHTHLYISFFFYVAILTVRLLPRLPMRDVYRSQTAFIASGTVWLLLTVIIFLPFWLEYGNMEHYRKDQCFQFHAEIKGHVKSINITIAGVVIAASAAILMFQVVVLTKVVKSSQGNLCSQQNFRAQLKNLTFLSVMVLCLLPYHIFRIHYMLHFGDNICWHNEIYLSVTCLCCLDLIAFLAI